MSDPLKQWDNTRRIPKLRLVTRQAHWPDQVYQPARSKWSEQTQAVFMQCGLRKDCPCMHAGNSRMGNRFSVEVTRLDV